MKTAGAVITLLGVIGLFVQAYRTRRDPYARWTAGDYGVLAVALSGLVILAAAP